MRGPSVRERYRDLISRCVQCGTCVASCPASEVSDFNIRRIVRRLQLDREADNGFLSSLPWLCTQCSRCHVLCTEGLDLPEMILALRRLAVAEGLAPEAAAQIEKAVREGGSPYRSSTRTKSSWIDEQVQIKPQSEILCWLGCTPSILSQNIARATARVLDRLGGGFRVLSSEPCCGEPLAALGLVEEGRDVAARAAEAIQSAVASGVTKIVTSCAGCYNTFTNTYPRKLGIEIRGVEILHLAQFLAQVGERPLRLAEPLRVTYHDPCSLGRHSGVYDPPREILRSIEGLTLEEMDPTREMAMCCGGGGGVWAVDRQMAMEIASKKMERVAAQIEVEAVVTSCPMCYNNFRYALKKAKSPLRVLELSEIVAMALE